MVFWGGGLTVEGGGAQRIASEMIAHEVEVARLRELVSAVKRNGAEPRRCRRRRR